MEQGAQGSCESDITGDTENPNGHSPVQPVVVDSVLRGGFGTGNEQRSLPVSIMLWFCECGKYWYLGDF